MNGISPTNTIARTRKVSMNARMPACWRTSPWHQWQVE
jgi:hypothetical protein